MDIVPGVEPPPFRLSLLTVHLQPLHVGAAKRATGQNDEQSYMAQ